MRWVFVLLLVIHALIHLLGFMKAHKWIPLPQIPLQISPSVGFLWLMACLGFIASALTFAFQWNIWWLIALPCLVLSEILIVKSWTEAKFGTVPNIIVLLVAVVGFGAWNFDRNWKALRHSMLNVMPSHPASHVITEQDIAHLVPIVQKWLRWSSVIGREKIRFTELVQVGRMRLTPEQAAWMQSTSQQLISSKQPGFIWRVDTEFFGLPILGRDKLISGQSSMWISLLGLVPIVDLSQNPKIDQSAMQRFLAELIWAPSIAIDPSIEWTEIDKYTAVATLTVAGTRPSVTFHFHPNGQPDRIVAERFKDIDDEKPTQWVAQILETKEFQGLKIPSKVEISWILPSGPFNWYVFEVVHASFK